VARAAGVAEGGRQLGRRLTTGRRGDSDAAQDAFAGRGTSRSTGAPGATRQRTSYRRPRAPRGAPALARSHARGAGTRAPTWTHAIGARTSTLRGRDADQKTDDAGTHTR
jgi:hypothetical protein